ncbi:hypothetical protein [Micromonospora sp. NPDC049102]|uniref:hypothetical protein n=1 Tax=Micromonospora sp. NPDC049102 TaxID=3364265 RepID=UPI00370F8565
MATRAAAKPGRSTLSSWAAGQRKLRPQRFTPAADGLRFAFYGRMSTVDFQDRASSCRWRRDHAGDLVAGHGRIVVEFFDEGVSRRVPWPDRPQASRLLDAVMDSARGFDAIVVGEYERAFHGQQLEQLTPTLLSHGLQLWLPETYGPVDFDNPRQLALLDLLGVHSQREVSRRGIAPLRPCVLRRSCRADISAAGHPTATGSPTPALIRTAPTPPGDGACTAWSPTLPPHP